MLKTFVRQNNRKNAKAFVKQSNHKNNKRHFGCQKKN